MINLKLLEECTKCDRSEIRYRVVTPKEYGKKYFFVGYHPGLEEELMCEPFAGIRRDFLNRFLKERFGILQDCYFTNLVKCGVDIPKSKHRKICFSWIEQEIELYKPKVVFTFEKNLKKMYGNCIELPALGSILTSEKKAKVAEKIIRENL